MTLRYRLISLFLLAALVPALIIGVLATRHASSEMEAAIGSNFEGIASAKALAIELELAAHVEEARVLATHPMVLAAARDGNASWHDAGEEQARTTIRTLDAAWIEAKKQSPTADAVIGRPLSAYLKGYQARNTDRYGEIFVTDRLGAAVAMTKRLSDYDQSDEQWWSDTFAVGEHGLFIDDRGVDDSVGAMILGVVVPVVDRGELLGVLKINYKVGAILDVVEPYERDQSDRVVLARGDGTILADSYRQGPAPDLGALTENLLLMDIEGWSTATRAGLPTLQAHAHVASPIHNRVPTEGAIKGVSGERWEKLGWVVMVEADQASLLAPVTAFWRKALVIGSGALALTVLLALAVARSVTAPLLQLQRSAAQIGSGDLNHRVALDRSDELGALSQAFDAMTSRLQATLASRDELDREVRERRRAERELHRALKELARSNQELEQFAYVASHDLQEPLRKVRAFGDRLAKRATDGLDERSLDYLQRMQNAAGRMQALIDALLSYSRVSSRARPFEPVVLEDILAGVVCDLEARVEATDATIEVGPLPKLQADPTQMRQLFQNLVSNALKFHHPDRPPRLELRAEPAPDAPGTGGGWRITLQDNGIGFEAGQAERIFEPFHRLHARSAYQGTGIGLAICAKIVQRHGGTLTASGNPGEGASFEILLPTTPPSGDQA